MKMSKEVVMVRISDIIPNRFQPRLTFDEEALNELANSIKEHGIIQPLILRDLGSKYEIIAGERRYKASQLAGLETVPAIVGTMDDQTSAELALIENIQRKDLTAIEEAKSYKIILDMGSFTQDQLAKRMGKSQSTIANKMRLLALTNEVQVALMNNLISERHARCLLQIKDEDKQKEVLNKIITERMNVRDTDEYIKNMLGLPKMEEPSSNPESNINNTVPVETQNVPAIEIPNNSFIAEPTLKSPELPAIEVPNTSIEIEPAIKLPEAPAIEVPNSEVKPVTSEAKPNENPNVYTQTNNIDFVNISSLNNEEPITNNAVKSALNDLDIKEEANMFGGNTLFVEDKEGTDMINNQNIEVPEVRVPATDTENSVNSLSKVKLATAIRIAKDTVEEIKVAGYNVTMEEVDTGSDYQIIIKVQK